MPIIDLENVYEYTGGLLNLQIGVTETTLLTDLDLVDPAEIDDDDFVLEQNDDGVTTINGDPIDYLGSGTAGLLGLPLVSVPVVAFDANGTTYLYFPDGLPVGVSLSTTITLDSTSGAAICFAAGTMITTPNGHCAVEDLVIGDNIVNAEGKGIAVKWIGRQTLQTVLNGQTAQPVRISQGALGEGLPNRDLTVTPDHGMVIDGVVINASALVNGTTINWVPLSELPDTVTYYHIETENHEVIRANGAPAETFIDYVGRRAFDNHAEYVDLYGCERIIPEMAAPRISTARLLPEAIRARFGIGHERPLIAIG